MLKRLFQAATITLLLNLTARLTPQAPNPSAAVLPSVETPIQISRLLWGG